MKRRKRKKKKKRRKTEAQKDVVAGLGACTIGGA